MGSFAGLHLWHELPFRSISGGGFQKLHQIFTGYFTSKEAVLGPPEGSDTLGKTNNLVHENDVRLVFN